MKKLVLSCLFGLVLFNCKEKEEIFRLVNDQDTIQMDEKVNKDSTENAEMAPDFSLPDRHGNQKYLADFRGKFVLMDIWATWCGPCIMQIPAMKALEERYKEKNLTFLSISVDQDQDKSKWLKMIDEKQMGGIHLFAGKSSGFSEDYRVDFIPRFILIDTQGKIMINNLPQPMDPYTEDVNPEMIQILDLIK